MADSNATQREPVFSYRISKSLVAGLIILILLIISASFSVIWFEGRPKLVAMNLDSQTKLGQNISLALERELQEVRGVARSIAASVMAYPENERLELIPQTTPVMLQPKGTENFYAGGGVWPEPYVFDKDFGRMSFFWAQNQEGRLEFFDDYNAPYGPGYHHEEWYVPARVFNSEAVYWSKSYTDPYSLQPMVTCTAPMMKNGVFKGVTTVDLKLEGVSRVLNQLITGFDAYAFIVDRNNRFIVFPTLGFDVSRTQVYSGNNGFEFLEDLARVYPAFQEISDRLSKLDSSLFSELSQQKPEYISLVNKLVEGSYQIDSQEAQRLVAHYWLREKTLSNYPKPLDTFEIRNDLLLRGDATGFIYQMPSTNWRIVTVFERRAYGAMSDVVSQKLFGAILLSSVIFGVCAFVLLKLGVINRISGMVNLLTNAVENQNGRALKLDYEKSDELGMLAYWFNRRTEQLETAIKSAKRANKAKSDFLAGMSQELRTPLNSIIGFNRRLIVKLGSELEEQNYKTLIAIQRSSHHLLSLIDDIMEVSELEAGKVKLKFDWESVNMLLDDAGSQMSGQIADAGLEFEIIPLANDIRIYADRQKIIQVLLHLLANALQATGAGVIRIKAEPAQLADQKAVAFSVIDTGEGISDEAKHVIFRQLTQVEERSGLEKGMGLGLYLIREITALHSGAVFFESKISVGSTFKVVFPISANLDKNNYLL